MEKSTQTMETNTTEVEYISIYDKPKRSSKYTADEKQKGQGYLQTTIIIETLKKKNKENYYFTSGKRGSNKQYC